MPKSNTSSEIDEARFQSAKNQLSRSSELINELEECVRKAIYNLQSKIIVRRQELIDIYSLKILGQLPREIESIAKDAASNIRDALDHAVYASAVVLRGGEPENTAFPICADKGKFDKAIKKQKGNPDEINKIILSQQPFITKKNSLIPLNSIRNPNTHRFIVPIMTQVTGVQTSISGKITHPAEIGLSEWSYLNQEFTFMILGVGSEVNFRIDSMGDVVFSKPESVSRTPVIPFLRSCLDEVQSIVSILEIETLKLKENQVQAERRQ